jgi:hypothetical protein
VEWVDEEDGDKASTYVLPCTALRDATGLGTVLCSPFRRRTRTDHPHPVDPGYACIVVALLEYSALATSFGRRILISYSQRLRSEIGCSWIK